MSDFIKLIVEYKNDARTRAIRKASLLQGIGIGLFIGAILHIIVQSTNDLSLLMIGLAVLLVMWGDGLRLRSGFPRR